MTVYVDPLMNHGWRMRGKMVMSCHLLTDDVSLAELYELGGRIGMKQSWLHWPKHSAPHFDLVAGKRELAISYGAVGLSVRTVAADRNTFRNLMRLWSERPHLVVTIEENKP